MKNLRLNINQQGQEILEQIPSDESYDAAFINALLPLVFGIEDLKTGNTKAVKSMVFGSTETAAIEGKYKENKCLFDMLVCSIYIFFKAS